MKENFVGYYRPSDNVLSRLWKNATFMLDANVLLNLYRYPKEARDDLLKVFTQIADRLWIPHQVALEYQVNRLGVIAEQVRRYDEVKDVLKDVKQRLEAEFGKLQLKRRHSSISPDKFLEKVSNIFDEFVTDLEALRKEQPDVFDEDKLRDEVDLLFKGRVGSPPESQAELDKIYEEGKVRYDQKCPPGYEDRGKAKPDEREVYVHRNLVFRREYGVLILWYQIIKEAGTRDLKDVIFITDDDKEDWWWIVESKGKKIIGPRPELVEELSSKAGVSSFYMYNSERFLEFAKKYLGIQVKPESIHQVRDITQLAKRLSPREIEILELAQKGLHNREIAQVLELSEGTVRNYLSSIYESLNARNRIEAIQSAIELGLLTPKGVILPEHEESDLSMPYAGLSSREIEILELAQKGLTNREIAETLGLSDGTVRNYFSNIYDDLNSPTRAEAIQRAVELGLLTPREQNPLDSEDV
jgi:DNA-binding NarL/FixJ family response regulator